MSEIDELKEFSENFFRNLGAAIENKENSILVTNVPGSFENFYGKKSPYQLVFDRVFEEEETDLIARGSYMLKAMMQYLDTLGQTTLLQLQFNFDPKEIFQRGYSLQNCSLPAIKLDKKFSSFLRFTFSSTLQYLNEKEQIVTPVYVSDGKVIDFDLNLHSTIEGRREDITLKDVKNEFAIAKEELKKHLEQPVKKISQELEKRLAAEIERVKKHHENQIKEIDDSVRAAHDQIVQLEKQQKKSQDKKIIESKIAKIKEEISELMKPEAKEKILKEQDFFVQDEIHKHSLNVDTRLLNTTIIYYPIFTFEVTLQNPTASKRVFVEFDPLKQQLGEIKCDSCEKELRELRLCSGGHVSCSNCLRACGDCREQFCIRCLDKRCSVCGSMLCRKCAKKCSKCGNIVCSRHMGRNSINARHLCNNCLTSCPSCEASVEKEQIVSCRKCGHRHCEKCSRQTLIKTRGKSSCERCAQD